MHASRALLTLLVATALGCTAPTLDDEPGNPDQPQTSAFPGDPRNELPPPDDVPDPVEPEPEPDPVDPEPDPEPVDPDPEPEPDPVVYSVDLDTMAEGIRDRMGGNAVGFAFTLRRDGAPVVSGGEGWARRPVDGAAAMGASSRMMVASVTKTMTAIATLRLLDELEVSVDSPIEPWLPPTWSRGAGFDANGVTFRQLLKHTSGLNQAFKALDQAGKDAWGNDWDGLEFAVANGTVPGSSYQYKNANYALLRVIIPALWRAAGNADIGAVTEYNHALWYLAYLQDYVFEPVGVLAVTCRVQSTYPSALGYDLDDPSEAGSPANANFYSCGGHAGLHLSAWDLALVAANLDQLLSPDAITLMDGGRLGWSNGSNRSSTAGHYYHGGDWYMGSGRELHACIAKMPHGVTASLVVNSRQDSGVYQCTVLRRAFADAVFEVQD